MNDLTTIERHARALMTMHGVGRLGFEFDRGKKRIGAMHYQRSGGVSIPVKITISKHYALILSMDEIRETMLHEIAHALTPGDGHGAKWKSKARELGARPAPCKAVSVSPEAAWKGICGSCSAVQGNQHRAPLRVYLCAAASCRSLTYRERVLNWKKNGSYVAAQNMPARFYTEWQRIQNMPLTAARR